jgi:hypothetical protein
MRRRHGFDTGVDWAYASELLRIGGVGGTGREGCGRDRLGSGSFGAVAAILWHAHRRRGDRHPANVAMACFRHK